MVERPPYPRPGPPYPKPNPAPWPRFRVHHTCGYPGKINVRIGPEAKTIIPGIKIGYILGIMLRGLLILAAALVASCGANEGGNPPAASAKPRNIQGTASAFFDAPSSVMAYSTVKLDGTLSRDANLPVASYNWHQIAGPPVTLIGATGPQISFTAPKVSAVTVLTFNLTVRGSKGGTSSYSGSIAVTPASAAQLTPTFVALRFLDPLLDRDHGDALLIKGQPLAGRSVTVRATLSGAVQSPSFSIVGANEEVLSTLALSPSGPSWAQPLEFVGTMTTPTVPFQVAASGITADGQKYSLLSPTIVTPLTVTMTFEPAKLTLASGASASSQLNIYNGGADANFTVQFKDPQHLLANSKDVSVQVTQGQTATLPLTVAYPVTLKESSAPQIMATASVVGDASRIATAILTVWLDNAT